MTKIIQILRKVQQSPEMNMDRIDALDDAIEILASNRLYQPNIVENSEAMDGDLNTWLNETVNYKESERKKMDESQVEELLSMAAGYRLNGEVELYVNLGFSRS